MNDNINMHGRPAQLGEKLKVWLPGESPFAVCKTIAPDGTITAELIGPLLPDLTFEQRQKIYNMSFPPAPPHGFRHGQIHRFKLETTSNGTKLWVLA